MVRIIDANCNLFREEDIKLGSDAIKDGKLVVFPTETVYGIGGDATSDDSCRRIFEAKRRPPDNPLIVHFYSIKQVRAFSLWDEVPFHEELEKLWPGPLTVITEKKSKICRTASAGLNTIGVRIPDCRLAQELIIRSGVPIAAPSANASGKPSGTSIDHIETELGGKVEIMYRGHTPKFGIESTVILPEKDRCLILRPGAYTEDDLGNIFGKVAFATVESKVMSPGTKYRHYSPEKTLFRGTIDQIKQFMIKNGDAIPLLTDQSALKIKSPYISLGNKNDPYDVSRHLYDALRKLDTTDATYGIIEKFPYVGYFSSIMNRIEKASVDLESTNY